jgi:hypothetical protein
MLQNPQSFAPQILLKFFLQPLNMEGQQAIDTDKYYIKRSENLIVAADQHLQFKNKVS